MLMGFVALVVAFMGFGWGAAWTERNHLREKNRCEAKLEALDIYQDMRAKPIRSER